MTEGGIRRIKRQMTLQTPSALCLISKVSSSHNLTSDIFIHLTLIDIMASQTKKLVDYTQQGKNLENLTEEYRKNFKRCASSLSTLSTDSSIIASACTSRPQETRREQVSSTESLRSTLDLLKNTPESQQPVEPIAFMLKIPSGSGRRRGERSDLRERFSTIRPTRHSNSTIETTLLGASKARRGTRKLRASF